MKQYKLKFEEDELVLPYPFDYERYVDGYVITSAPHVYLNIWGEIAYGPRYAAVAKTKAELKKFFDLIQTSPWLSSAIEKWKNEPPKRPRRK